MRRPARAVLCVLAVSLLPSCAVSIDTVRTEPPRPHLVAPCARVAVSSDADADGLTDACELALARAWAPTLLADPADCSWTGEAGDRRLAGGYFFAVEPVAKGGGTVRIAYLPAYLHDCGWRGMQRVLRLGRTNAHAGDSELIVVDVARDAAHAWSPSGVFLSAHCGGRSAGRCRWFREERLREVHWGAQPERAGPDVWVSRDKHANYPSRDACESGHWGQERCAVGAIRYRFPVHGSAQNIGNRRAPSFGRGGCVAGDALPLPAAGAVPERVECFWESAHPFAGWQLDPGGAADPYSLVLERLAEM